MVQLLIIIFVVWYIFRVKKQGRSLGSTWIGSLFPYLRPDGKAPKGRETILNKSRQMASAIPNKPKKLKRTKEEVEVLVHTHASSQACHYEAAYSKGRPDRIGQRGDYEEVVPSGRVRIRCAYCNAENFVPMGTHEHYHCYFCWEKL